MMINRIELFRQVARRFAKTRQAPKRNLYTVKLYPYPHNYINNEVYPGQHAYRETWPNPPWLAFETGRGDLLMKMFWTFWWYQLFSDPGVILGHWTAPDVSIWTDEQLGIPPDAEGSYAEWLSRRQQESS